MLFAGESSSADGYINWVILQKRSVRDDEKEHS